MRPTIAFLLGFVVFNAAASVAADVVPIAVKLPDPARKEPVSYSREVAEFLSTKCLGCHNESVAENRLNMEDVASMLKGGKSGPGLIAGAADQSLIFQLAAHRGDPVMPPDRKKQASPLTSEELGLLKAWIDAGAVDDSEGSPEPAATDVGELPANLVAINALDLDRDGRRLAVGRGGHVEVVDVDSGLEITRLFGLKDYVESVRFSPDGHLLAAGGFETVELWNAAKGSKVLTFEGHEGSLKGVVPLGLGNRFTSIGLDSTVRVWESDTGKLVRSVKVPNPPSAIAADSGTKRFAVGFNDGTIRILAIDDGHEIATIAAHSGTVHALAFVDNDRRLVSAGADGSSKVWNLEASPIGLTTTFHRHRGEVFGLVPFPDGRAVATSGADGTIRVWNIESGRPSMTVSLPGGPISALALAPDGSALLSGSADGVARLIDRTSGAIVHSLRGHRNGITALAFNRTGDRIAVSGGVGGFKVWETANGRGVEAFCHTPKKNGVPDQQVSALAFLRDDLVVSGSTDKTLKTWRFEGTWTEKRTLGPHAFRVLALDFNPDGTLLATGGGEPSRTGEIKVWEVGKGMLVRTLGSLHSDTVFGLRFNHDGTLLASAGADKFVKVTEVAGGKEFRSYEGHTQQVLSVDWKGDGKQLVSGGADSVLKIWDVESGEQARTLTGPGKQVISVRWVPGKAEVVGSSGDHLVRIWNSDNAAVVRNLPGASDYLNAIAITIDGTRVFAGGADGVLYEWDGTTGALLNKQEPGSGR